MKSAIFQDQATGTQPRIHKKSQFRKRPRTSSPFIASPVSFNAPKWNLEEMISNYTSTGALPTPLSPTLPPRFSAPSSTSDPRQLGGHSADESDIDAIPMSLLSPTLPGIFRDYDSKSTASPIAHPLPEKPRMPHVSANAGRKNVKVRWVDKMNDTQRPRFLVRISFDTMTDTLRSGTRARVSGNEQGLAIFPARKEPEQASSGTLWPKSFKQFVAKYGHSARADSLLSIVVQFDWIICSAISCDMEEKSTRLVKEAEIRWANLHADIPSFVQRIERFLKTHSVSDKRKSYLSFLVAILAVCKALILKRANAQLIVAASKKLKDDSPEGKESVIGIQQQIIENYSLIESHFAESQSFFNNSPSPLTLFPKAWANRMSTLPKVDDSVIVPSQDKYCLPLGPYSDLRESFAFLYCCVREFCQILGPDNLGEVKYNLQSGSKR